MLKKKITILFFVALIAFLGVLTYSQMNQYEYRTRLNNSGLSDNALLYKSSKKATIGEFLLALNKKKLTDYQIQFKSKEDKQLSFIYGKGKISDLPLESGQGFTEADFESRIPVVLIGNKLKKNIYSPTDQSYLKYDHRYLSIIGVLGASVKTNLDHETMISMSPNNAFAELPLSKVNIVIDGAKINQQQKTFKKLLQSKSPVRYVPKTQPIVGTEWLSHNLVFVAIIGFGLLLLIGLTELWIQMMRKSPLLNQFEGWSWEKIKWGLFRSYLLRFTIAIGIGFLLGTWRFYLLEYQNMSLLYLITLVILTCYFYWRLEYLHRHQPKIKG